jgi:hypothetical protein
MAANGHRWILDDTYVLTSHWLGLKAFEIIEPDPGRFLFIQRDFGIGSPDHASYYHINGLPLFSLRR